MKIKIFRGLSTEKLLKDIKRDYGDKAIILSTRTVKENDIKMVEIMVAIEGEIDQPKAKNPDRVNLEGISLWNKWQAEWQEFKKEIFSIFKSNVELNHIPKKYKLFLDILEKEEVLPEVIFSLYKKVKENPDLGIKRLMEFVKKEPNISFLMKKYKVHVFSGPSGVGKSTTLIKIALKYKKIYPTKKICIVNGDVFNVKKLFLKYYSDLYSLEYKEVKDPVEWLRLFSEKKAFDKVFIDLPSLKKGERMSDWLNSNGLNLFDDVCFYLMLSPVYSYHQIETFLKQYLHPHVKGVIWTKLDEANKFGNIINTCFYTNIPISLVSYGPQLKNSLATLSDKSFLELVLKHKLPSNSNQEMS